MALLLLVLLLALQSTQQAQIVIRNSRELDASCSMPFEACLKHLTYLLERWLRNALQYTTTEHD
jgi:hypothetical protein